MGKRVRTRNDNVVPMRRKVKKPVTKRQTHLLMAAILLLAGLMVFILTQCKIETIIITGNETYTQDEVEAAVRNSCVDNSIFYTVIASMSKNDYLPFIEKSEVTFLGKNVLKVEVQEKLRAGVLKEMSEYFYFDKDGIIREESQVRLKKVPLVTGLKMKDCVLNEKMNPREEGVFPIILKMTQLIIKYDLPVEEIQFNTLTDIRLKLPAIQVKFGTASELDAKMAELPSILESLSGMEGVLDMESYTEDKKIITFQDNRLKKEEKKEEKQEKQTESE